MSGEGSVSEVNSQAKQEAANKIQQSKQYQQIQQDLAQKKVQQDQQAVKPADFQDKVEIKSLFNWKTTTEGDVEIRAEQKNKPVSSVQELKYSGDKVLRLLGYKINLSEKVDSMKENYMRLFVETKSPNLLLAKFSQVKFGMLSLMLSMMGVSSEELKKLQKKALASSIEENEELFEQNEYNLEMLLLFGNPKKDRGKKKVFIELRKQLSEQMDRLGKKGYYSQEKLTTVQKDQVLKIRQDLLQEKENLEYLSEYQT